MRGAGGRRVEIQAITTSTGSPLQISRCGDYRICVTGILPPFTWVAPLCSGPFRIR